MKKRLTKRKTVSTFWRYFFKQKKSRDNGLFSEGNKVKPYFEGDDAFRDMLQEIRSAKQRVHLEIYIFNSDSVGMAFSKEFIKKAREGIEVRVVYDAFGSKGTDKSFFRKMREQGVELVSYRPFVPWRIFGRNHRKLLVIDSRVAFIGGMNLADEYSNKEHKLGSGWRDTHIRVEGPAARDCDILFSDTWKVTAKKKLQKPPEFTWQGQRSGSSNCAVIGSRGVKKRRTIERLFSVHIGKAQKEVQITVPYFVPPRKLRRALEMARNRSLDVEILVPQRSDIVFADWVRKILMSDYSRMGIKIYEYESRVLHAKTMVIDQEVALIGSANFDFLSVVQNLEIVLVVYDPKIAQVLLEQHQKDLLSSRFTKVYPVKKLSILGVLLAQFKTF